MKKNQADQHTTPVNPQLQKHKKSHFLANRWYAFRMALQGMRYFIRTEKSAWIELTALVICVVAGWWLQISRIEWAIVLLTVSVILALEAINTAIESVVDLVSPEYHPLAKIAKDTAAAALIFAVIGSLCVAALIFF